MMLVIFFFAFSLWTLVLALCFRNVLERTYSAIDAVLDGALSGGISSFDAAEDTRLSKFVHKAMKAVQTSGASADAFQREKESLHRFLSDMSHQMKTPLSGIRMYAELLADDSLSREERLEFLSRMRESAERLQWLVDSLVKMSRMEAGAIALSPVPAGIKQTISDSIASILAAAEQKGPRH